MTIQPILVPVSRLSLSPHNVRQSTCAAADAQLKASLLARGVLQNLVGVPQRRPKGHFAIIAGGRRLRMVQELVAEGALPADHLLPVLPIADAQDALETSLDENFQRLGMNPAEECAAFGEILARGAGVADVARRFGVTVRFVEGRLRLSRLAPAVLEALRDGLITLDVAQAFATTTDVERQARVFERERAGSYDRFNPWTIRRLMIDGAARGSDPRARLVGRDAYLAAGGRIDADLFSDEGTETWCDGELLERLAGEQMAAAAAALQREEGWGEVRWTTATTMPWEDRYRLTRLEGSPPVESPARVERRAAITAAIAELEAALEADGGVDGAWERLEALEAERRGLEEPVIDVAERAGAITYLVLAADGSPCPVGEAYAETAPVESAAADEPASSDDEAPPQARLSQRLLDELAAARTRVLALHLARDPDAALGFAAFVLAERATRVSIGLPSSLRADPPALAEAPDTSAAARGWEALDASLDRTWTEAESAGDRFARFAALGTGEQRAWLAWAVARSLEPARTGGAGEPLLAALAGQLAVDLAAHWRPTAANFFDRISKATTLEAFAAVGGDALAKRHAGLRRPELAAAAERLFAGDGDDEASLAARRWLPAEMAFVTLEAEPAADAT